MKMLKAIKYLKEDIYTLEKLIKKPTIEVRVYKRAKILLMKSEGLSYEDIGNKLDLTRPSIKLCIYIR